jgi:hypothetical protein
VFSVTSVVKFPFVPAYCLNRRELSIQNSKLLVYDRNLGTLWKLCGTGRRHTLDRVSGVHSRPREGGRQSLLSSLCGGSPALIWDAEYIGQE